MLPMLSGPHIAAQLQVGLRQALVGSSCQLRPLLDVLYSQQQQQVDLGHQFASSSRSIVTGHTHVPRVQHDRYRTAPQNYVQLLQHITRTRDVEALSKLVKQYGGKFDAVHVAAAVAMVPKLYQPPAPGNHLNDKQLKNRKKAAAKLLAQLQVTAASQVPRMFASQVSSITYALSRCSSLLPGGSTANKTTQQLLDAMLARMTKDHSRLLWQGADGSSITYLLHGLSRMGYSPHAGEDPASSSSSSSSVGTSGSAAAAALHTTQQLCKMIIKNPDRLQMRELATSAWALARISRNVSDVRKSTATAAALDAISQQVVERKLWLRPTSMTGLLTAAAWMGRRDDAMLDAICEEATHQLRDLQPDHLAAFVWALSSLDYTPPAELLSGIVTEARRKLQGFTASSLGLLLLGLRELRALDKPLLAEVAAGIAAEPEVSLAPRDAARILAAFVATPDAGTVRDVEGMAQRIASAIRRDARRARPRLLTELVMCYGRLPYHHPMLPDLLGEAGSRGSSFSLRQWGSLLQSAQQLGYARVMADPQLEATLWSFYKAGDVRLRQHVRQAILGRDQDSSSPAEVQQQAGSAGQAAGEGAQQAGSGEEPDEEGLRGRASKWYSNTMQRVGRHSTAREAKPAAQRQGGGEQSHKEAALVAQMAEMLGQRGSLSDGSATDLADAGKVLLPVLKLRSIVQLLSGLTSKEHFLANESVRAFVLQACQHIKGLDLGSTPTGVLVGLLQPLSRALSRHLVVAKGEELVRAIYAELLPVLEQCSQAQLQSLWQSMRRADVADEGLAARVKEVAGRNGWKLQSGALTVL